MVAAKLLGLCMLRVTTLPGVCVWIGCITELVLSGCVSLYRCWDELSASTNVEIAFLTSLQEDIWSEESMKGWDDADMGTWNDSTLENNSTWNSATGFNKNLRRNSLKVFKISEIMGMGLDSDIIM